MDLLFAAGLENVCWTGGGRFVVSVVDLVIFIFHSAVYMYMYDICIYKHILCIRYTYTSLCV